MVSSELLIAVRALGLMGGLHVEYEGRIRGGCSVLTWAMRKRWCC